MCYVNVTEFRKNISEYIERSANENINVTKNGTVVAVLTNPDRTYYDTLIRLCGCMQDVDTGEDYDEMIGKEILRRCGF